MPISQVSLLKRLWQGWIRFGHWIGNVMSWVWMPLFYFVVVTPFALFVRLSSDPLRIRKPEGDSFWVPKQLPKLDMKWARSQGSVAEEGTK